MRVMQDRVEILNGQLLSALRSRNVWLIKTPSLGQHQWLLGNCKIGPFQTFLDIDEHVPKRFVLAHHIESRLLPPPALFPASPIKRQGLLHWWPPLQKPST